MADEAPKRATKKAPVDFLIDTGLQQWAREQVPGLDIRAETEKFRDHTFTTARSDWVGTWRNWMRRAHQNLPTSQRAAPAAQTQARRDEAQQMLGLGDEQADFQAFSEMLDAVCLLLSRGSYVPSSTNTALWWRSLAGHDLAAIRAAFDAHVKDPQRGRFVPTPADILLQIEGAAKADGRPGPEEAWAVSLRCADEAATVVWTDEMAQAWGIALPIFQRGDEVGARMAFKESYTRLVEDARKARRPAAWNASLGHDLEMRSKALQEAAALGRLTHHDALALPGPRAEIPLLAMVADETSEIPDHARAALRRIAEHIASGQATPKSQDAAERDRTQQLQAEAKAKVANYQPKP